MVTIAGTHHQGSRSAWEGEITNTHLLASQPSSLEAPAVSCGHATLHLQAFTFLVGKWGSWVATSDHAL